MALTDVIEQIDAEIAKLQQAKALLGGISDALAEQKMKPGRPKGSTNAVKTPAKKTAGKRTLSPEARKAIADAQKKRWAEKRKAADA